jgi:hypothetical protein
MRLEAQVQGVHAAVGNYEIFTSSIEAMDQALKGLENSLVKSDKFKKRSRPYLNKMMAICISTGHEEENVHRASVPIVQVVELVGKPLFDHLRSLSVSSYGIDNGVQRSKLFFRLDNANES